MLEVNGIGKPCTREPHARFEWGAAGKVKVTFACDVDLGSVSCNGHHYDFIEALLHKLHTEPVAYLTISRFIKKNIFLTPFENPLNLI